MNLTIDIGNTNIKMGIFERNEMKSMDIFNNSNQIEFTKYFENIPENTIKTAIICSVIDTDKEFIDALKSKFPVIIFDSSTPIPIKNLYQSPNSLGPDRLASVIGARLIFPKGNILSINAGTCVTYNFLNENNEYIGGSISPGLTMRYRALHNFTSKLPLLETIEETNLVGRNTMESIKSGVINGIVAEVDAIIEKYKCLYGDISVIMTGGDSEFLVNSLKNSIFAAPYLVLQGLNEVVNYNLNLFPEK
jgi:type III pantothenate kinase